MFAIGVLYLFSIQRVSNALERHLEAGARSTMKEGVVYDGVVLLGGIVDVLVSQPDRPRARTYRAARDAGSGRTRPSRSRIIPSSANGMVRPCPDSHLDAQSNLRLCVLLAHANPCC